MADEEVKLVFKADESGALAAMNKYSSGLKRMESDTGGLVASIKSHWLGISATVASVTIAISKGWEFAKLGAGALQAEEAFRAVARTAGISADATIDAMKRMTADTIDDSDLMQKGLKSLTQGLSGDDMVKIAEIARVAARTAGVSVGEAYEQISDSIANNMPKALKKFGLTSDEELDRMSGKAKEGKKNVDLLATAYDRTKEKIEQMGGALQEVPSEWMQVQEKNAAELKEAVGKIILAAGGVLGNLVMNVPKNLGTAHGAALMKLVGISPDQVRKEVEETNKELERLGNLDKKTKFTKVLELEDTKKGLEIIKAQISATTKAFADMGSVISSMGGVKLGFAGNDFKTAISEQANDLRQFTAQYQSLSDTMKSGIDFDRQISRVGDLTSAFMKYGGIIDDVYTNQITMQRDILDEMKNYEKNQANIVKQAASITQTEIKYNEAKLSSYQSYYDELKKLQKGYYDAAVKSAQDIANIEKAKTGDQKQTGDLLYSAWDKANPAANEMQQYYRDASRLDQELTAAMSLSAEERVKALGDIQRQYAGLSKQITTNGSTVSTYDEVSKKIVAIGDAMAQARDQMIADATATRDKAIAVYTSLLEPIKAVDNEIKRVQSTIANLDTLLSQQRILSIDTSGALSSVQMLIDRMNTLSGIPIPQIAGGGSSYAGSILSNSDTGLNWDGSPQVTYYQPEPYILDQLAIGTDYVPRTGLYKLHQGEAVTPAAQNKGASPRSVTVNLGGIVINSNVSDPKRFAKQIALDVEREINRLDYMRK
jgi:hypothetical protein